VGLVGNQDFQIGDTLSEDQSIKFNEMPRFAPECFAQIYSGSTATGKRFREGLDQLLREGVAQAFELKDSLTRTPLLGAVGPLQFEVLQYRIETEYGAQCRIENASWSLVRWIRPKDGSSGLPPLTLPSGAAQAKDANGAEVVLFPSPWSLTYFESKNPDLEIATQSFKD